MIRGIGPVYAKKMVKAFGERGTLRIARRGTHAVGRRVARGPRAVESKVAQATELNQAAAGHAVKAVVNAILDALLAGDAVRVSGLGIFNVMARPAREGRNPQTGETIQIGASKAVRFHAGKAVKDALNPPAPKATPRKKSAPPKKSTMRK